MLLVQASTSLSVILSGVSATRCAVLHHPEYRERYAANLRGELPRIPFAASIPCHPSARKKRGPQDDNSVFHAFVAANQGGGEG